MPGLPRPRQRAVARPFRPVCISVRRRAGHRPAVSEHECRAVRGFRRDHGADACPHQLPDRLRSAGAGGGSVVRGRLDRSRCRGTSARRRLRLPRRGPGPPAPTSADCLTGWRCSAGVTIYYEAHIHPLWSKPAHHARGRRRHLLAGMTPARIAMPTATRPATTQGTPGQLELVTDARRQRPARSQARVSGGCWRATTNRSSSAVC